jgi:uncharacterized protein (DUF1810 family)
MSDSADRPSDAYNLSRFVEAQKKDFEPALAQIVGGKKRTHWMWYIFPQLYGLAPHPSENSKFYAIKGLDEARAYLAHPVLGPRLLRCAEAAAAVEGRSADEIFGDIDARKLRSCATLFACVAPPRSVFERLLAKYYGGERDAKTLRLLGLAPQGGGGSEEA